MKLNTKGLFVKKTKQESDIFSLTLHQHVKNTKLLYVLLIYKVLTGFCHCFHLRLNSCRLCQ